MTLHEALAGYFMFGLVLIRCSGLAVFSPFFGSEQFPLVARIGMVFFFALLLYPAAAADPVLPPVLNMPELALLALQEVSLGLVIGFMSSMVFMGAQLAGELIDQQIGFSMANILDPITGENVTLTGYFQANVSVLLFLLANLHLLLIYILYRSYDFVRVGELAFPAAVFPLREAATVQIESLFTVAARLATPMLLVMLMNSVVEGFVTRTMPQMNIMVLGLPLRVALGMTALMLVTPYILRTLDDGIPFDGAHELGAGKSGVLYDMIMDLGRAVQSLAPAGGG